MRKSWKRLIASSTAVLALGYLVHHRQPEVRRSPKIDFTTGYLPPLVMDGGDPYLRALMRTISASESNHPQPYTILYGGQHVEDLSSHPEKCITIVTGPNQGNCSTAAGRYQMLNTTWKEKAQQYHPQPPGLMFWRSYSFQPEFQDAVVYAWLSDRQAWGTDIAALLRQGNIDRVLRLLSPTWTSLGYGIEDNVMTQHLPQVYQKMLQEELKAIAQI
ncbi:glycoside hydrolase family protein [Gloeocapsopsis crepidinum LEGE 06123]|uniref:Glycoside hydrolase family protein n=1 Tax=Gloeocapsopsis crepidinum LEGE 06123 TaxID=588587 RepID=A0ABR9UUW8_9CHRO|nr:glycoside hydrolase family protein [Gloeocapsopsis crepidinum]MBE9191108.1 glycoside hydrolase family protein [Gloeocapsopsis crepidinum LEGE 06123]